MEETYEVGPGRVVTIRIQVDDAMSTYDPGKDERFARLVENYARSLDRVRQLEDEVARLKRDRGTKDDHTADGGWARAYKLSGELDTALQTLDVREKETDRLIDRVAKLENQVREYDRDRTTERDRADQNRQWAERTEKKLEIVSLDRDQYKNQAERRSHVCTPVCLPNAHIAFEGRALVDKLTAERDAALVKTEELETQVGVITDLVQGVAVNRAISAPATHPRVLGNIVVNVRKALGISVEPTSQT
jgi:hypothetical protein